MTNANGEAGLSWFSENYSSSATQSVDEVAARVAAYRADKEQLRALYSELESRPLPKEWLDRIENRATPAQISMAKRNNVDMALQIAREARQIHGGMGITGEYPIMRHMMNLESVITYEGTHDVHLLITGYDITGISAFE